MPLTATLENTQSNLYQLLNRLDLGEIDKVNIVDNEALLAVLVTWPIYVAADPGGSAQVVEDIVAAYSGSPAVYSAPLYRLTKRMRDRENIIAHAQKATGSITAVAGANTVDAETFTIKNAASVTKVFEFDSGGGVNVGAVAVPFTGAETAAQMAGLIQTAINGATGFGVVAAAPVGAVVGVTQSDPGSFANFALSDTVLDAGFLVAGFLGGTDIVASAGVIGLKMSKNDATFRAALVPADHAADIGL